MGVKREEVAGYDRRRHRDIHIAELHFHLAVTTAPVALICIIPIGVVENAVAAQGEGTIPAEPLGELYAKGQLCTHAIRILHVLREVSTGRRILAGKHELIVVIHEIEVESNAPCFVVLPPQSAIRIAQLIVVESLGLLDIVPTCLGVVLAVGFAVGNGKRAIEQVAVILIRQTGSYRRSRRG